MSMHQPQRTCIACKEKKNKSELLRLVRTSELKVEIDISANKPGRGAYLCYKKECINIAVKKRRVEHNLKVKLGPGCMEELLAMLGDIVLNG